MIKKTNTRLQIRTISFARGTMLFAWETHIKDDIPVGSTFIFLSPRDPTYMSWNWYALAPSGQVVVVQERYFSEDCQ